MKRKGRQQQKVFYPSHVALEIPWKLEHLLGLNASDL